MKFKLAFISTTGYVSKIDLAGGRYFYRTHSDNYCGLLLTDYDASRKMLVFTIIIREAEIVRPFFLFLGEKVGKRPVLTVFIATLITIALISGVTQIWMATGNETFIKTSTDIYQSNLHLEEMFGGENIVIRFKAEDIHDLLTVENLVPLDRLETALLENDNVYSVIGPATTIRHMTEKQAGAIRENVGEIRHGLLEMSKKLAAQSGQLQAMQNGLADFSDLGNLGEGLTTFSAKLESISEGLGTMYANSNIMAPQIPTSQDTLDMLLYENGEFRPIFAQMVVDEQNAVMMVRLTGNASAGQIEEVVNLITDFVERYPLQNTATTVTGKPVLDIALRTEMRSNMQKMVFSALILMVVIVSVVFKVRWRLFTLVVNFGAVVATMGLMGHLGIPMTMVSMAAFPILIGLGIDYSIQFHNRYEEEFMSEEAVRHEV
jgi:predicted RND superfamily exporter protein